MTANTMLWQKCIVETMRNFRSAANRASRKWCRITATRLPAMSITSVLRSGRPNTSQEKLGVQRAMMPIAAAVSAAVQIAARRKKRPQLPPLAIALEVAAERTGQAEHDQRRREQQEAVGHVPLAELVRREPAAEQHAAAKADAPLHDAHHQQHEHARGERIGREPVLVGLRNRIDGSRRSS